MKKTVRGTIIYKAPPVIQKMKTKERLEQYFELDIFEPELGRQRFVYHCQNPEDLKWWHNAVNVEVTFWAYHYVKSEFPINALKTSEVRELTHEEVAGIVDKFTKIAKQKLAERRKKHSEDEKKKIELRKQQQEERRKNPVEWTAEDW
ncbi:MAG: hypothetical protein V2B15_03585 [Bacteroidota bacterium]